MSRCHLYYETDPLEKWTKTANRIIDFPKVRIEPGPLCYEIKMDSLPFGRYTPRPRVASHVRIVCEINELNYMTLHEN